MRRGSMVALAAVALGACQTAAPPMWRPCDGALHVSYSQVSDSMALFGKNDCFVPIGLRVDFDLTNYRSAEPLPVVRLLPPHTEQSLAQLNRVDPNAAASFRYRTSVLYFGPAASAPDPNARYAFPFGGTEQRELIQGPDGDFSHKGKCAFDFGMPIGTPVLAARSGVVLLVTDGFGEGKARESYRNEANSVFVLQEDGTVAAYVHLVAGVPVTVGKVVAAGDLLGHSGNSGYSSRPHLHFEVNSQGEEGLKTIPILFRGNIVPDERKLYGPYEPVD